MITDLRMYLVSSSSDETSLSTNMRSFRVDTELHLLHVDDHERGDAGGEDEEHDDDVDHGIPLHPPLVVGGPGRAADQQAAGVLQLQQAGHVHQVAAGVLDYHQLATTDTDRLQLPRSVSRCLYNFALCRAEEQISRPRAKQRSGDRLQPAARSGAQLNFN